MLLSHDELLTLISNGVIENATPDLVNGTSIDVTLAPKILVEMPPSNLVIPSVVSDIPSKAGGMNRAQVKQVQVVDYRARNGLHMEGAILDYKTGWVMIDPGSFILCSSEQIFNLPNDISCEYKLKSSMARIGLEHLNAGWCDPGWHGSALTLEFLNVTRFHSILLRPGDRIGQVVFFRSAPVPEEASYTKRGRYNQDKTVTGIKP